MRTASVCALKGFSVLAIKSTASQTETWTDIHRRVLIVNAVRIDIDLYPLIHFTVLTSSFRSINAAKVQHY